jgi:glycosyltransferase involved in cell wall biosynthesis
MSTRSAAAQPFGRVGRRSSGRKYLAFAYACEPAEGSEPGAGWMWARMLAQSAETWVLTRANNRKQIESSLRSTPERDKIHFVYVDLPAWLRFWKRGTRGVLPYYMLWQFAALKAARRLHQTVSFDVVWHLTFANAWLGSAAWLVGPPFVFGPVGGGVGTPWNLVPSLGLRSVLSELVREIARASGRYLNPLARMAWRRARLILVQNQETARWLPAPDRHKARVFPNVVLSDLLASNRSPGSRPTTAMFAGRLIGWKGVALAIRAISQLPAWRLLVCGKGPDEGRLRRLVSDLDLEDRVTFTGWLPRSEVLRLMREEAGVFLFPSLHDEAGWVVVEALMAELPTVCLDRGGPPLLINRHGIAVSAAGSPSAVVARLARALEEVRTVSITGSSDLARRYVIDRRAGELLELLDLSGAQASSSALGMDE